MRIALIAHGTRGDVQPMVAVAARLARRGHEVVLGVPANLVTFVQRAGLTAVPLAFDSAAILDTPRGHRALSSGNFYGLSRWLADLHHRRSAELDDDVLRACRDADLVVSNFMLEERAAAIAEARRIPLLLLHSMPLRPSRELASAMVTMRSFPWGAVNVATHRLFIRVWWGRLRADTNVLRRALGIADAHHPLERRTLPAGLAEVQAYSRLLVPELEQEWAALPGRSFSGFIDLATPERALLDEERDDGALGEWLDAGDPPVYVGFGSMPLPDPAAVVRMIADACAALGLRALIVSGQDAAHAVPGLDPARIRLARAVDHDVVLPRTVAAVHHGGAGTLSASLGAGLPTMVCSFFADQPFWGSRIERLGIGCHLRFRDLDQAGLERGLRHLLEPETGRRARGFAAELNAEPDGAGFVADMAEKLLDRADVRG